MELSKKEEKLVRSGKIRAVIREESPEEWVGNIAFEIDGIAYRIVEKRRWTVARMGSQRGKTDFGCDTIKNFKATIHYLYGKYSMIGNKIRYEVCFAPDKKQKTLGIEEKEEEKEKEESVDGGITLK